MMKRIQNNLMTFWHITRRNGEILVKFGEAVEAMKDGFSVARHGWNGKGMFVYYVPPAIYQTNTEIAKKTFGEEVQYNAYLAIKNVDGTVSTWVPSINDVLSEDWVMVAHG